MECPVCSRFFSSKRIAYHAAECKGGGDASSKKKPVVVEEEDDDDFVELIEETPSKTKPNAFDMLMAKATKPLPSKAKVRTPPSKQECTTPTSNDAFSMLMSSAKEKAMVETFIFDFSTGECEWTNNNSCKQQQDGDWIGWVKLGRGLDASKVRLLGRNLPNQHTSSTLDISPKSRLPVGTLKSIMQKAYRRMDLETFRKTACELAAKSWSDFIRRLPIVILEDGYCTARFPALVWLMLANSAHDDSQTVTAMQALLCNNELALFCINSINFEDTRVDHFDQVSPSSAALDLSKLESGVQAGYVFAMRARGMFGGMKCDVEMCQAFAQIWYQRFLQDPSLLPTTTNNIQLKHHVLDKLVGFSDMCCIPSCGIDTHCQPQLFEHLATRFPELSTCLWHFRSGLNFRTVEPALALAIERGEANAETNDHHPELYAKWREFAKECEEISVAYLNRRNKLYVL